MPLGGLITIALLLPNLLFFVLPPRAVPPEIQRNADLARWMEVVERIGQVGCFLIPFFYALPALREASVDALAFMALSLGFYYAGWLRYAFKGHRFVLLFAPLLGVPLPMALSPLLYFATAAIYLRAWPLGIAVLPLAAGHLYMSWNQLERCNAAKAYQPS